MKLNKIIPYKLKRALPILGLTGLGMVSSCEKQKPEYLPEPSDITIYFDFQNLQAIGTYETPFSELELSEVLKYYVEHPDVQNIFLTPVNNKCFMLRRVDLLTMARKSFLQPALDYSPKIHGKGTIEVVSGDASKVPADSLWYVQNGWNFRSVQR